MGITTFNAVNSVYYNVSRIADAGGAWNSKLYAGQVNGSQRSGIKFNLTGLTNKTITKATLKLYYVRGETPLTVFDLAASNSIDFTSYSASGNGQQLVNDTQALSSRALGITTDVKGWREIDVSDLISSFGTEKVCFYILLNDTYNQKGSLRFQGVGDAEKPQLVLEWRENASTFTTNKDTVVIGSSNDFSITIKAADASYKHRVHFILGDMDKTWTDKVGDGTLTGSISADFANKIPNSSSMQGVIKLETYSDTTLLGTSSKNVSFSVPQTSAFLPTFSSNITNTPNGNCYANYTTWNAKVSASAKYGASIRKIVLKLLKGSSSVYQTEVSSSSMSVYIPSQAAGSYSWGLTITDSRGFIVSSSLTTVSVANYTPIYFSELALTRTDEAGTPAVEGIYYKLSGYVKSSHNIASVSADGMVRVSNTGVSSYDLSNIPAINTAQSASYSKTITISATDGIKTISQNITLPSAQYILYFKKGGTALGIGKAADSTEDGWLDIGWKVNITNQEGSGLLRLRATSGECSMYFYPANGTSYWGLGPSSSNTFSIFSSSANKNLVQITSTRFQIFSTSFMMQHPTNNGYVYAWVGDEGGNIEIRTGDDYKRLYQMDANGGNFRIFSNTTSGDGGSTGLTYNGATGNVRINNLTIGSLSSPLTLQNGGTGTNVSSVAGLRSYLDVYNKSESIKNCYIMGKYNNSYMTGAIDLTDLTLSAGRYWMEIQDSSAASNTSLPSAIKSLASDRCEVVIRTDYRAPATNQYRIIDIYSFTNKKTYRRTYWWNNWNDWYTL